MKLKPFVIVFLGISCTTGKKEINTRITAERICDNIIEMVDLSFERKPVKLVQERVNIIYFSDSSKSYEIKTGIAGVNEGDFIAIAANEGRIRIKLDGEIVFSGDTHTAIIPQRLDYELIVPERVFELKAGTTNLEMEYVPGSDGISAVFIWFVDEKSMIQKHVKPGISHNDTSYEYIYKPSGSDKWRPPLRFETAELVAPLDMADWRYFTGIYLDAFLNIAKYYNLPKYKDRVNEHLEFITQNIPEIRKEREEKKLIHSPFGHFFRYTLLDDFGTQTLPFLAFPDNTKYAAYVDQALRYIESGSLKLEDGTFCRNTPDTLTVWADDLYMGSTLLSRAYKQTGNEDCLSLAIRQVRQFDKYLKDGKTGLYWHGYFAHQKQHSSSKWARANGWIMMAKAELLSAMPENHEGRPEMLHIFESHAEALKAYQSEDGRWHQVLDNPSTYLETSSTAMFVRTFAEGMINGWLDESFGEAVLNGWKALLRQIDDQGNVSGIVKGTPILFSDDAYDRQKTRLNDPRGLGAVLYATIAMDQLVRNYPDVLKKM